MRDARSLPNEKYNDAYGLELVKTVKTKNDTFYFYKDNEGNYYFETEGQRKVEEELGIKKKRYRR